MHRFFRMHRVRSTRIHGDVQCTRLRLTLARKKEKVEAQREGSVVQGGFGDGGGPLKEGTLGRRRSVCSRAMNYAVRRGLRPRMPLRGRRTERERHTARDADGDILARSRATLLSSFSLASRSFSLLFLLAASTCVCHHLSPPPLPSSLPPSPPRRRLLDAPARITPPTLCSDRLKFSYRHVYRPSLCLEQVKCTATGFYYAILHLPSPLLRRESGREASTSVSLPSPFGIFQFSSVSQRREAAKYDLLHGRKSTK